MDIKYIEEATSASNNALVETIENWQRNDPNAVLVAFAEIERRGLELKHETIEQLDAYCQHYNHKDINSLLSLAMQNTGYRSYGGFYNDFIRGDLNNLAKQNSRKRYPALRTICDIYRFVGYLSIVATFFAASYFFTESGIGSAAVVALVGLLLILGVFATAESIMLFIDIEHNTRQRNKE